MANVQVWEAQLQQNDFPPVCAMTGAPAEMWRKFTFTSTPAYAMLFGAIGAAAFSERVAGYLPLTRQSSQRITLIRWAVLGILAAAVLLGIIGGVLAGSGDDSTTGTIGGALFVLGFVVLFGGLIAVAFARGYRGPTARIIGRDGQRIVELRRVHPAFVEAVKQLQQVRAAERQAAAQQAASPPPPPQSPFPPGKFSF